MTEPAIPRPFQPAIPAATVQITRSDEKLVNDEFRAEIAKAAKE